MAANRGSVTRAARAGSRAGTASRNRSNRAGRPARPSKRTRAVSVSRLVGVSPIRAFDALSRPKDLSTWFTRGARARRIVGGTYANRDGDRGRFLEIRRPTTLRMTWENPHHCPGTVVAFRVERAARGTARVSVRHARLATARDAETMKAAWSWALDSFRSYVETGVPITVEAWQRDRRAKTKRRTGERRRKKKTAAKAARRKATRRR